MAVRKLKDFEQWSIEGRDPSRAPVATPYSYLQNHEFDARYEVGKLHSFLGKGATKRARPTQCVSLLATSSKRLSDCRSRYF